MKNLTITPYIKDKNRLKAGKAEVYMKIRTNAAPVNFPTNCYVEVKRFEQTSKFTTGRLDSDETIAKDYLNELTKKLNQIEAKFIESNTAYTVEMIKNRILEKDVESVSKGKTITDAFTYYKAYFKDLIAKGQRTEGALSRYNCIEDHLKDFIKEKFNQSEYLLEGLNHQFQKDFHTYLVNKVDENGKKLSHNTHIKYIYLFRKVIKVAVDEAGWIKVYPFVDYEMVKEEEVPSSLTLQEVQQIMNFDCGDNVSFQKSKDFFLMCCYTGLAHCDLLTLERSNIKNIDGDKVIVKRRIKIRKKVVVATIRLQPEAVKILERYAGQNENPELCFPYYSDNSINTHIKTIAKQAGIKQPINFYMARHSFACINLLFKQSLESIKSSLGHSSVKQTEHYARSLAPQIVEEQRKMDGVFSNPSVNHLKKAS